MNAGISVGGSWIRAAAVRRGRIVWAGETRYAGAADLADAIARLAAEASPPLRSLRVVLERDIVATRTLDPSPLRSTGLARRYVAIDAARLFRVRGPAVSDAAVITVGKRRVLWAAAAPAAIAAAIERGCREAGIQLLGIGIAADYLPRTIAAPLESGEAAFPNSVVTELVSTVRGRAWRSRQINGADAAVPVFRAPLAMLGERAKLFAPAFGAATGRAGLCLLTTESRGAADQTRLRAAARRGVIAVVLVACAGAVWTARLMSADRAAARELATLAPALQTALAERRDLRAAQNALATMAAAERNRSEYLRLLGRLSTAAGDSLVLVSLNAAGDSLVRLSGYTPLLSSLRVTLEREPWVRETRVDAPALREVLPGSVPGREWDRFALTIRAMSRP